ncbi:MAG: hypothetical protein ACR2OL_03825 [Anderseniella sp.]
MGEAFLHDFSGPARPMPAPVAPPLIDLSRDEDPIECDTVKRHGCAFWRGDWHVCDGDRQARVTVREFGHGGPGYCFFELRCGQTHARLASQDWYLNWRSFTPARGMRLIADYRSRQAICA